MMQAGWSIPRLVLAFKQHKTFRHLLTRNSVCHLRPVCNFLTRLKSTKPFSLPSSHGKQEMLK